MKKLTEKFTALLMLACLSLGIAGFHKTEASPYRALANTLEMVDPQGTMAIKLVLTAGTAFTVAYKLDQIERSIANTLHRMGIKSITQFTKHGIITILAWKFWSNMITSNQIK